MSKLIDKVLTGESTSQSEYAQSISRSTEAYVKDNISEPIKRQITEREDQIADIKRRMSLTTDVNRGIVEMTREEIHESMDTIYKAEREIALLKRELKDVTTPFVKKWFADDTKVANK